MHGSWLEHLRVGDLVNVNQGFLYRITRLRRTGSSLVIAWQRVHRQTLAPTRYGGAETVVAPHQLAWYQCYDTTPRGEVTEYRVRMAYPEIAPDML